MSPSLSSIRVVPAAGPAAAGIGKYRYIAELAAGGMATVFLAITKGQPDFQKLLVIKELHANLAQDPTFVAMFTDEARLAARLNHPNIVQTYEVGSEGDRHFIAMEFLDGVPYTRLARMRADRVPPPIPLHVRVLCDVLYGLHEAHELRDYDGKPLEVVHRDVSPQNIMMLFAGGVKVLDFGIAKAALAAEQRPEDFKGKIEYMAPEQAMLGQIDRRADIFAVGVMLWEALARRRLFEKGEDKFARLISGELPDLLTVRPDAPKGLATICKKAMARNVEDRFATAADMAHALEDWLDGTTQHVKNRDVGAFVTEKFGTIRKKIRDAVEEQLSLYRDASDDEPDTLPVSRLPFEEVKLDGSEPPPPIVVEDGSTDEGPEEELEGPPAPPVPLPIASPTPAVWVHESTPAVVPPVASPRLPRARSTVAMISMAGVIVVAFVFALGAFVKHRRNTRTAKDVATTISSGPIAVKTDAPLDDIEYTVRASPSDAKIAIDGQPMGNPATGKRPKDGAIHVLRVEAPGYEPREEQVTFDRSVLMSIELRALPPPPPPPPALERPKTGRGGKGNKQPKIQNGLDTESGY